MNKVVISLGAGVQSSTLALMAAHGEVGPLPVAAIFADTQNESPKVYAWLDWLETQLPFPILRTTKGDLFEAASRVRISKQTGLGYVKPMLPAFVVRSNGKHGMLQRQCTETFKIHMIQREIRRIRVKKESFEQWIGISTDEAHRMKPSLIPYIENRWPLIDQGMSRGDCLLWMAEHKYPKPPRSSCVYCPYHSDEEWLRLKTEEPDQFRIAVEYERRYQESIKQISRLDGVPYFHDSRVPLDQVEFKPEQSRADKFGNECFGMCGN